MNNNKYNFEKHDWMCGYCKQEKYELMTISHRRVSAKIRSYPNKIINIRKGNIDISCPHCAVFNESKKNPAAKFFCETLLSGNGEVSVNEVNLNCFHCGKKLLGKLLYSEEYKEIVFSILGEYGKKIIMNVDGVFITCPECNKDTYAHNNPEIEKYLTSIINQDLKDVPEKKENGNKKAVIGA